MTVAVLAGALLTLLIGTCASAALRAHRRAWHLAAVVGSLACGVGAGASAALVVSATAATWRVAWSPPINGLSFGIDPLSAFFLLCIFVVGGVALLYSRDYFEAAARPVGSAVAWLQGLILAMALVVLARDMVGFLVAWEAMFLASYRLVTFDAHDPGVRAAGFTYLVASHISVTFLFILFGLCMRASGSVEFAGFVAAPPSGMLAAVCFGVALVGFGIKAGMWPLHGWLPEAHPAAPTPVSALMSGVMIKMGIYGLLRTLTFLGPPRPAWGITLLVAGAASALAGVLLALAQHDLKRLLAYHSVENIGIILLGIGVGLLGQTAAAPGIAFAGYAGALLHTLNHGLFKGLLFQAAGAVAHVTGSRDIETHGGVLRRMPVTGAVFLIGAVAISGLPPLNGFASEWLIFVGALRHGLVPGAAGVSRLAVVVVPVLGLVGGLAAACFVKVFGVVFLGEPRSAASARAHEVGVAMRAAMALGAAACVALGVLPAMALRLIAAPAALLAGAGATTAAVDASALHTLSLVAACLGGGIAGLLLARQWMLRGRPVRAAATWDCGYALPNARMQYTAASFASPVLDPFVGLLNARGPAASVLSAQPRAAGLLRPPKPERQPAGPVSGWFPQRATAEVHFEDPGEAAMRWTLAAVAAALARLRVLQRGPVQLYLLYVLVTLLLLLIWQVRA